jgi:hypothetical protein
MVMAFELDHLFICTDVGAAVADRLAAAGLIEGSSNVHPGQGTANRRFFFGNAMLELLWVHDPMEAQSELIRRTRLWERWRDRDRVCPFGICLRPDRDSLGAIAVPSWDFRPPYLPDGLAIWVGDNSDRLTEPMLFQTPFGRRPDQAPPEKVQPLNHPLGLREITRLELVSPIDQPPSLELRSALNTGQFQLRRGDAYWIELGFDGELAGEQIDFRSELPLVMSW